jgi:hypothetical protein
MFRRLLIVPLLVLLFGVRPAAAQNADPGTAVAPVASRGTPKPRQVQKRKPKSSASAKSAPTKTSSAKKKNAPSAKAAPKKASTRKSKKSSKKNAPTTVAAEEEVIETAVEDSNPSCRGVSLDAVAPLFGPDVSHFTWDGELDCGFGIDGLSSYVAVLRETNVRSNAFRVDGPNKGYALGKHALGGPRPSGGYAVEVMAEGGVRFYAVAPTENAALPIAQGFLAALPTLAPTQKLALSNGSCPTPGGELTAKNLAPALNAVVMPDSRTLTFSDQSKLQLCVLRSEGWDFEIQVWNVPASRWGEFARDFATAGWLIVREPGLYTNAMEATGTGAHFVAMSHPRFGFLRIHGFFAAQGNAGLAMTKNVTEQRARALAVARALVAIS